MRRNSIWERISNFSPWGIVIVFIVLSLFSLHAARTIKFSYNYEDFFPKGDADLNFFYDYRNKFEPDDNFLLIGFKTTHLFDHTFLSALDSATAKVSQISYVDKALSISNFRYFIKSPFGYIDYPAVHTDDISKYTSDSIRIKEDERINGKLVSNDFTTAVIFLKVSDSLSQSDSRLLVDSVKACINGLNLPEYHMLGKAYFQVELIAQQHKEFMLYALLSVLLVSLVTYLMFKSWWCVALSLITVVVTMILFLGVIGLLGIKLNVMSVLYPIVIIIIGISDTIHFISKYIQELRIKNEKRIALHNTLNDIGLATFLTAVTSAIGFLSTLTSNIPPIREFGIFSAIGVLIAYFVCLFFMSPLLLLFSQKQLDSGSVSENKTWRVFIDNIYNSGKKYPRRIIVITAVVMLIFGYGMTQISTDIHLEAGMPKHAKVSADFTFFERNFNGFRPFEIASMAQDTFVVSDLVALQQIDKVEKYVAHNHSINGVQSINMLYKSLNRANNGDIASQYKLPDNDSILKNYDSDIKKFKSNELNLLISEDKKYGRINGFLSDVGTDSIHAIQADIQHFINTQTDSSIVKFKLTGTGLIFDKNTIYLRRNIISGVTLAFLCISLLMALLFRDWKMVIISIIPNIIPLIICAGIMGLLHIELDAPTSVIFEIAYGIAVDDTIHFLSKFKIEREKGFSVDDAIYNTFQETGRAVFMMSLILFFGFIILLVSPTQATFNIGLLTGITLLTAVWPDFYLLPLMLRKWIKD